VWTLAHWLAVSPEVSVRLFEVRYYYWALKCLKVTPHFFADFVDKYRRYGLFDGQ